MLPEIGIICGLIALSLPVPSICGVFRGRNIAGPARLSAGESVLTLAAILLLSGCTAMLAAKAISMSLKLPPDQMLDVINGAFYAFFLAVALLLNQQMRPAGIVKLGLNARKFPRAVPLAFTTAVAILPLVYASSVAVQLTIDLLHHALPSAHPMLQQLQADKHSIWFLVVVFEAVVLVPIAEETLFRGHLQTVLVYLFARRINPSPAPRWAGMILTAALFAAAHGEPAFFLPLFVLAIGLGYLYERTGNLWASALMHGLFNAIQIVIYLSVSGK